MLAGMDALLPRRRVEELTGLKRSYIYYLISLGAFPVPLCVGPRGRRWRSSEVEQWIESRPRAGRNPREEKNGSPT